MTDPNTTLADALATLINPADVDDYIRCAVEYVLDPEVAPPTSLLHPRFNEDLPGISDLAGFLWKQCFYYALPRRKQKKFLAAIARDPSMIMETARTVQSAFMDFSQKNPSRSSEVGEVIAYTLVQHLLKAPQVAAKMALKTSANMPVHGLDGIHARFEDGAMTVFFLEAKLTRNANAGAKAYAESAKEFLSNRSQYLREYDIVADMGNLDDLQGDAREAALEYFDVVGKKRVQRRERYVGVVCYSEKRVYAEKIPIGSGPIDAHENHFAERLALLKDRYRKAALKHLKANGADPAKCFVFFLAVPDVNHLRREFYTAMGLPPPPDLPEDDDEDDDEEVIEQVENA
ncbi:HamA C-terminal domain-containing protein [Rhizobium ruizarguesonis]|uniref:HamA C-terminal domain-containing protein n=1 Tax=Rhizobium ruizarguesonis TaxID=2081791 RepID=UPI0010314743|nr:DUF1837 domain-containing protein [Rhizobium ruizarguesonis]TAZ42056.1 DUF1837 domain-containing protein [Rhizobium ruizarguesonis]TBA06366.1 DUF1837 domain-containing protein [Rhizobium ruizarguesonis]